MRRASVESDRGGWNEGRDKERGSEGTMDVVILTEMASRVRGYEEHVCAACEHAQAAQLSVTAYATDDRAMTRACRAGKL